MMDLVRGRGRFLPTGNLNAVCKTGAQEGVNIAIQNSHCIGAFDPGPQIPHQLVRVQDVVTDLMAVGNRNKHAHPFTISQESRQ